MTKTISVCHYGIYSSRPNPLMKTLALLAVLAAAIYYHHGPDNAGSTVAAGSPEHHRKLTSQIVAAPAPSYGDRWKTGPNASTNFKSGPDAQVHWEPFLPNEQANWNQTPGYTIVSSSRFRIR